MKNTFKSSLIVFFITLLFTDTTYSKVDTASFITEKEILRTEYAIVFSYVNDVTGRQFRIYKDGILLKTVAYNPANQSESFGEMYGEILFSYVNDVTSRQFRVYKDGTLWKTVAYNLANQSETFGMVEKKAFDDDSFDNMYFYSYVNDITGRQFRIYRNGSLWQTHAYNPANQSESYGHNGGRWSQNNRNSTFYSYVNDLTRREFRIYADGTLRKTVAYSPENQSEFFEEVTFLNSVVSYVNDVTGRQFRIYKDGTLWKTVAYNPANQSETFGNVVSGVNW